MSRAAITSAASVRPEIGLFDEPISPTRLPETAAKKKPTMIITIAATIPGLPERRHSSCTGTTMHSSTTTKSAKHELGVQVAFRAGRAGMCRGRLLQVRNGARHAAAQTLAHAEQRVAGADQHSADRDRPHDEAPHRARLTGPEGIVGRWRAPAGANCSHQLGPPRNRMSGTSRPQAITPPAKFSDARRGPMM